MLSELIVFIDIVWLLFFAVVLQSAVEVNSNQNLFVISINLQLHLALAILFGCYYWTFLKSKLSVNLCCGQQWCGLKIVTCYLVIFTFVCKIVQSGVPYFYAEIPGGVKLYSQISRGFPLQFGR